MVAPIINPEVPYNGEIPGGLEPGRMCRLQGVTHPEADRFNINFQTGSNEKPRDDTALHMSVRLSQGYVARNSYKDESWGDEQGSGTLPIGPAQSWEIIILVDKNDYKIAINGQHFCEFPHRIPLSDVTHLLIDGDVSITLISWEGISGVGNAESSTRASQLNAEGTQGGPQGYGGAQPAYGPQGGYGGPGGYGGYGAPTAGYGIPQTGYGGYAPPPPPGAESETGFDNFWNQAQGVLAGAIKSGAAEKLLGGLLSGGGQQAQPQGYAPQNAKYGIYPDLPKDFDVNLKQAQMKQQPGPVENLLSGLLAGGNKQQQPGSQQTQSNVDFNSLLSGLLGGNQQNPGAASGHQQQHTQQNVSGSQQGQGVDIGSLLGGLLSGNAQQQPGQTASGQNRGPPGAPQTGQQSQGIDLTQMLGALSGLMSNTRPVQETGTPGAPQPGHVPIHQQQGQGGIDFNNIISNLLSGGNQHQQPGQMPPGQMPPGQMPPGQMPPGQGQQQNQGIDLNALLSGMLSGGDQQHQKPVRPSPYNVGQQEQSQGPDLGSLLSGLLSGGGGGSQNPQGPPGGQSHHNPYTPGPPPTGPYQPPHTGPQRVPPSNIGGGDSSANSGPGDTRPKSSQPASQQEFEDVSDKLADVIASEGNTGRQQSSQSHGQQQYGQYPHPPQEQRGPFESLLTNFLGGGGGGAQSHQQQPQFGGGESIGGLGSMSGFLSGLAGSVLQPRDGNQRHNY